MLPKQYFGRILTILLLLIPSVTPIEAARQPERKCALVIMAQVASIGENPRMLSGRSAVYWLASYKIVEVFKGHPLKAEIRVAHLVLKGNELESVRVGDKVLLCLNKPNKKLKDAVLLSADYVGELILLECNCRR
jgi:hypothetical protein